MKNTEKRIPTTEAQYLREQLEKEKAENARLMLQIIALHLNMKQPKTKMEMLLDLTKEISQKNEFGSTTITITEQD